jgi:hypothetical protein
MDGKSCARLLVIAEFTRIHAAIDNWVSAGARSYVVDLITVARPLAE